MANPWPTQSTALPFPTYPHLTLTGGVGAAGAEGDAAASEAAASEVASCEAAEGEAAEGEASEGEAAGPSGPRRRAFHQASMEVWNRL